ncbi:MAG: D-alanyl-D-alanine carboxypeptidase [Firmicutes bacterium]|nr:D-alanyl-D-alanine carboxypeptidase [Bacillota bacterium]
MFLGTEWFKVRRLQQLEIILIMLALAVVLFFSISLNNSAQNNLTVSSEHYVNGYSLQAKAACLYDFANDKFLYEAAAYKQLAPASTGKLLTALTAVGICDLNEVVTIGKEIHKVPVDASRAWLREGEILTIRQLLYAMLLPSGNDAAYALAAFCGRKLSGDAELGIVQATELFVQQMNKNASALGVVDSCFLTPDGYDQPGQYSTAHDLALIAAEFCRNEELMQIVSCFESCEYWISGREAIYYNTNDLLNPDSPFFTQNALGLKTGTSSNAGACLVGAKEIGGEIYIAVILGSREDDRYRDCLTLFDYAQKLCTE